MEPTIASHHNKLHKSKGKMVKPILKKLSHSEKNSLDLDRPWEEQQGPGLGVYSSTHDIAIGRTARDVSFTFTDSPALPGKARYQHGRSPSGNSHASIATTASGGSRPSGLVYPFQQTPRTQTPPMAFNNSLLSLDSNTAYAHNAASSGGLRDYSPTITENEDDDYADSLQNSFSQGHNRASSHSQSVAGRPSLSSQRAASFSDINAPPQLRVNTTRAAPSGPSRRAYGTSGSALVSSLSQSDLQLNTASTLDSPSSGGPAAPSSFSIHSGTASSNVPLSPLRSSFEGVSFPRLRSRSELYALDRNEQIREARRKFEERERVKAEKHDREMIRKRERRDQKEARELEKQAAAQVRKNSGVGSDGGKRPSLSRKTTPTLAANLAEYDRIRGGSGSGGIGLTEKAQEFKSSNYDNMAGGATPSLDPTIDGVAFQHAHRNSSAKRRTQGYWTGFILWLRTRLFRLGRR